MSNDTSGLQQQFIQQPEQPQQQEDNSVFKCDECGLKLNSPESLDVHKKYHKNTLMRRWGQKKQLSQSNEETNNNSTKMKSQRESISNNITQSESSDTMVKNRTTPPETGFGHPPTPQSYQSASSPYQNQDNTGFSPNFQNYQLKTERESPVPQFQPNYTNYQEQQHFFTMDPQYNQDSFVHKSYRCHPYSQPYDRQAQPQVSSSSPAYPPQPTPSPSPKQCDKCGCVCESASQLIEHINLAHPPTPAPHLTNYQPNQHFMFDQAIIKQEDTGQSEILDLDSHKVVHNVYNEDVKPRLDSDPSNHSISTMLNPWPQQHQQKMFQDQQNMFMGANDQKLFHQVHNQDFIGTTVRTAPQETHINQNYRSFEHMPSPGANAVISSSQIPSNPTPPTAPVQKGSNWKSNEARRPKTYNCTACNKWFTSSGHLKRHYNTTLHKNAVKSSGQPDPAGLPISAHHHPARDNNSNKQDERPQSGSSGDDIRSGDDTNSMSQFERIHTMPGLLQQPPIGPYDRQPAPNIQHNTPLHSPMGHSPISNLNNGSPNGEAGLSNPSLDSRGLLSPISTTQQPPLHGFNMAPTHHPHHMMPGASMEENQYQMYPNEFAPHVSQAMVINNPNITGDFSQFHSLISDDTHQPLPSFAQIQAHRFGGTYQIVNVGGQGPVTVPFTNYYNDDVENEEALISHNNNLTMSQNNNLTVNQNNNLAAHQNNNLTILTTRDPTLASDEFILGFSPSNNNNNNNLEEDSSLLSLSPENNVKVPVLDGINLGVEDDPMSPEQAHTKRDYEEDIGSPSISSTVLNTPCQHRCYPCNKLFNKACYLTQHNKTFHCGDKPYKCTRCGKRFSSEIIYEEHIKKHAGEKPHKCEICPKQFNHKTDLRRHMCLHTGQKPFACDTCGKGFIRKDHMMKHCETHARKKDSKVAIK